MSQPKTARNKKIVALRQKDPKTWTIRALAKKFGFKSHNTVQLIVKNVKYWEN